MISRILGFILTSIYARFFRSKVQRGSLKAVRGYVKAVELTRMGLMGLLALGGVVALFLLGITIAVAGLLALTPIDPRAMAITALVVGILLVVIAGTLMFLIFNQRTWLRYSKAYDMMEATLAPWPSGSQTYLEQANRPLDTELVTSR